MASKQTDFKDNSMNSGDFNDLTVTALELTHGRASNSVAAPATIHFHSRTFIQTFHPMGGVLVFVLYITSLSTNENGRYLTYLNYPPQRKSAARGMIVDSRRLSWSLYVFLSDVISIHALLTYCEASRKSCALKRVQDFVINDLRADRKTVENWDIRNIHRVPNNNNDPSPIIVSFLKWKDKDFLLRTGKELRGYNDGKKHWVSFKHDLCKGSRAARKSMGIEATSIRENQQLLARVCDNAKGQVWLQTKKRKEDNWNTVKSYKP